MDTADDNMSSPNYDDHSGKDACSRLNVTDTGGIIFFEFIIHGVLLCIISILGLIGNCVSIFILSRKKMRSSLSLILIGMASFDSAVLISALLMFAFPAVLEYTNIDNRDYSYIYAPLIWYSYPLGMIAQTGSVYITLIVTIERYIAVCHPLRARSWCTHSRARLSVLMVALFSVLYNIPRFFELEICVAETGEMSLPASDMRRDNTYIKIYIVWLYDIVVYIVPFTLLAVLNAAIYEQIRTANKARMVLTNSQRKEIGLATMLLCVVVVFFMCNMLAFIVSILEAVRFIIPEMVRISNLFVTINSSVNFFIYCTFGEKFKRLFLHYFCNDRLLRLTSGRCSPNIRQANSMSNIVGYTQRNSTICTRMGAVNNSLVNLRAQDVPDSSCRLIQGKLSVGPHRGLHI